MSLKKNGLKTHVDIDVEKKKKNRDNDDEEIKDTLVSPTQDEVALRTNQLLEGIQE